MPISKYHISWHCGPLDNSALPPLNLFEVSCYHPKSVTHITAIPSKQVQMLLHVGKNRSYCQFPRNLILYEIFISFHVIELP